MAARSHIIQDSRLQNADVLRMRTELDDWNDPTLGRFNKAMVDGFRQGQDAGSLIRGVASASPKYADAMRGVVSPDSDWVQQDYSWLDLPGASYWSDPGLLIGEAFWALNHAFGGDFPTTWDQAQQGLILANKFGIFVAPPQYTQSSGPSTGGRLQIDDAHLARMLEPFTAWKFGKDEHLVFSKVTRCIRITPWELALRATASTGQAETFLAAAYLSYLHHEAGSGMRKPDAAALLLQYAS